MWLAIASTVAGAAVQGVGSLMSAGAASASAEYNAQIYEHNANTIMAQADAEARDQIRKNNRQFSSIRAAVGANGLSLEGAPLDVIEDSALEGATDVQRIRYKGVIAATDMERKANLSRMEGKAAETAGYVGAASSLFNAGGKVGTSLMRT